LNAFSRAQSAYASTTQSVRTDRDNEYRVIAKVSHELRKAAMDKSPTAFAKLAKALEDNRRLWTQLAIDVASPGNGLPEEIRGQIFYLAEFVQQHTAKAMKREVGVKVLLEINAAILGGLSGKVNAK
jgi:flagellar protein FlaF